MKFMAWLLPFLLLWAGDGAAATLAGVVKDSESKAPLYSAVVHFEELRLHAVTAEDGTFEFPQIPPGSYHLRFDLIGFCDTTVTVAVAEQRLRIEILMHENPLNLSGLDVYGDLDRVHSDVTGSRTLPQEKLDRRQASTLAEAVDEEAGIAVRSMGPAPSRPVVRGFGGDRLLLLEDGQRTGDLSATSADHAVVLDPANAEQIELIRGPGSLLYGSYTLGGVLNAVHNLVPARKLQQVSSIARVQGSTANEGASESANLAAPIKSLVWNSSASRQRASDSNTPEGVLKNSFIRTDEIASGVSWFHGSGHIGVGGNLYETEYGLPGGFVGAHPNGVRITMDRKHLEGTLRRQLNAPVINDLELRATYSRYHHAEYESNGSLGVEFGVLTYTANLQSQLNAIGSFDHGALNIWHETRDFASGGFSFNPGAVERSTALAWMEDAHWGSWNFQGAMRGDVRMITPTEEKFSNRIGHIRERSFGGFSGALLLSRPLSAWLGWSLGLMRSYRAPTVEELFSEGPHLAAYSFEIGNPELKSETGTGVDLTARLRMDHAFLDLSGYYNDIHGFVFPRNTGRTNFRTLLPEFRYQGLDAHLFGFDLTAGWQAHSSFTTEFSLSYVRGELAESQTPLPMMPPLQGRIALAHELHALHSFVAVRGAADQNRVDVFEEPTAAYLVFDFGTGLDWQTKPLGHHVQIRVENLLDTDYRNHLSRVKSILPEAGRNLKAEYSVSF